ncbi:hypothetical protein OIV83_000841 [Microbotryomycetes sp. JL201]|nr:hypothetical protein OIV83_000841 [Microbotryomycetes sp. JL201]
MTQRTVLAFATLAALSAGTNYAFSSWAPQLADRLHLSSKATNLVGAAGNAGVYLSGPSLGMVVDRRGCRLVLSIAAATLFMGYLMLHAIYVGGETGPYRNWGLTGLVIGELLTGVGSSAGLGAAVNGVSKSFSAQHRGAAVATVVAGFGLSAFLYSSLSRAVASSESDSTSTFLLLLAFGCGISMVLGSIFVRPVLPLSGERKIGYSAVSTDEPVVGRSSSSRPSSPALDPVSSKPVPLSRTSPELDGSHIVERHRRSSSKERETFAGDLDVNGRALLVDADFHVMFAFLGLCAGIGLMYLNNLGTIIVTLSHGTNLTPAQVSKAQAHLVSLLSICNCLGRLAVGFAGDWCSHHCPAEWRFPRIRWYMVVAAGFMASQVVAVLADSLDGWRGLFLPTAVVGLSYGALFSVSPVVCLERFGLPSFATNNGILTLSPAVFGNLANAVFGYVYDSRVDEATPDGAHLCTLGRACFAPAFYTTILMSLCAFAAAVVLSSRRSMR